MSATKAPATIRIFEPPADVIDDQSRTITDYFRQIACRVQLTDSLDPLKMQFFSGVNVSERAKLIQSYTLRVWKTWLT